MTTWIEKRAPSHVALLHAAIILMATTLLHAAILKVRPADAGAGMSAAVIMAFGLMAIAARLYRHVRIPKWSLFASTGVLAVSLIVAEAVAPAAATTRESLMWMFPWYFTTFSMFTPMSGRGACGSGTVAGRVLLATSVVLGLAWVILARAGFRM